MHIEDVTTITYTANCRDCRETAGRDAAGVTMRCGPHWQVRARQLEATLSSAQARAEQAEAERDALIRSSVRMAYETQDAKSALAAECEKHDEEAYNDAMSALAAMQAERDREQNDAAHWEQWGHEMRQRAELAEAERDAWKAKWDAMRIERDKAIKQANGSGQALADALNSGIITNLHAQERAALTEARRVLTAHDECIVCKAALHPAHVAIPHCVDCVVEPEHEEEWDAIREAESALLAQEGGQRC